MNFATISATLYHRHDAADAVFSDNARVIKASEHIAKNINATTQQTQILLTSLCVIVLRELAILTEYSQLDSDEINKWFAYNHSFYQRHGLIHSSRIPYLLIQKVIVTHLN